MRTQGFTHQFSYPHAAAPQMQQVQSSIDSAISGSSIYLSADDYLDFSMPSYGSSVSDSPSKAKADAPTFGNPFKDFDFSSPKADEAPSTPDKEVEDKAAAEAKKAEEKAAAEAKKAEEKAAAEARKAEEKARKAEEKAAKEAAEAEKKAAKEAAEAEKKEKEAAAEAKKAEKEARRQAELEKQRLAVERAKEAKEAEAPAPAPVSIQNHSKHKSLQVSN